MAYGKPACVSGSTNGRGIKVTGTTSGAGVTVHTAVTGTSEWDYVDLWAWNSDTTARTLTVGFGGTTAPDDCVPTVIPAGALVAVGVDRWPLQNALVVKAWADAANVVVVGGRYTRTS